MRRVLRAGALGRPGGMGWGGRWEGGLEWGTHVDPWLIHVDIWQKPLQYYNIIILQLTKINEKKRKKKNNSILLIELLLHSNAYGHTPISNCTLRLRNVLIVHEAI